MGQAEIGNGARFAGAGMQKYPFPIRGISSLLMKGRQQPPEN
jgi:hypothetical protein